MSKDNTIHFGEKRKLASRSVTEAKAATVASITHDCFGIFTFRRMPERIPAGIAECQKTISFVPR